MNKMTKAFCWIVLQLDRIPRYGRLYKWDSKNSRTFKKPIWKFMKNGRWGFHLLDKMNLLWPYIYETNPDLREAETYYCPTSGDIEHSTHGGFDVCCDAPEKHIEDE